MALLISPVYRQLDSGGRLARFELFDVIPMFLSYSVTFLAGQVFGYAPAYAYVVFVSVGLATYFINTRFELGLMGLVRFIGAPKHFSALASDTHSLPYPAKARHPSAP